jgi:hypothetical protein
MSRRSAVLAAAVVIFAAMLAGGVWYAFFAPRPACCTPPIPEPQPRPPSG